MAKRWSTKHNNNPEVQRSLRRIDAGTQLLPERPNLQQQVEQKQQRDKTDGRRNHIDSFVFELHEYRTDVGEEHETQFNSIGY